MEWKKLLSNERRRESSSKDPNHISYDYRTDFEKDYHRIVGSSYFRRLQDKTQVYSLDQNDFIRTRLTHSLEVSSFAKSLGKSVGNVLVAEKKMTMSEAIDISDILMCSGLIHDIGNPPFGHYGETAIQEWFKEHQKDFEDIGFSEQMWSDFTHFEGNAQSFRIVSRLHHLMDDFGMNLTMALMNTIIKYPIPSHMIGKKSEFYKTRTESGSHEARAESELHETDIKPEVKPYKKYGYFLADEKAFKEVVDNTGAGFKRYPLMLLLEAADDIAYCTADIEDGVKKGFLTYDMFYNLIKDIKIGDSAISEILNRKYKYAENKSDAELVAIQNFMVTIQGRLIAAAVKSFTDTNYEAIMNGNYSDDLFKGTEVELLVKELKKIAYEQIFKSSRIAKHELAANKIIYCFLDLMIPAVIKYDSIDCQDPESALSENEKRAVRLIPEQYKDIYKTEWEEVDKSMFSSKKEEDAYKKYLRILMVTDFISGMTDHYAKLVYQDICGIM